jgi:23S rRNA pseudouridine1911/1915/1917 synthase
MSGLHNFKVESEEQGQRLDAFLVNRLPAITRSFAQKLITDSNVSINGLEATKAGYKVKPGDEVIANIPAPVDIALKPEAIPLDICYEDRDLVVVNKPRGMVVHPAAGHQEGTLVNALLAHCSDLSGINGVNRPGIVHRLDKDTSGLLMVAKNDAAHNSLAEQLQGRTVKRCYLALVQGQIKENSGKIEAPIGRDPRNRQRMAVGHHNAREAITYYYVLQRLANHTFLELRLETGRTHQIRVHMNYIGYPVVGDPLYGPNRSDQLLAGQFLHAATLGFNHPRTEAYMEFSSPLPVLLQEVFDTLS